MPLFLLFSTKTALTVGAIIGGTVAVVANREKVLEVAADILQHGADYCNAQLAKNKIRMACQISDGEYANYEDHNQSEATTPSGSDDEADSDDKEDADEKEELDSAHAWARYGDSQSTLISRSGTLKVDQVD